MSRKQPFVGALRAGCVVVFFALWFPGCTSPGASVLEAVATPADTVVLIHGLGRRSGSLNIIADALHADGYRVCRVDYASTRHGPPELLRQVTDAILECAQPDSTLHVVTHSLGGILLRGFALEHGDVLTGRTVMLAPPNGGSELGDLVQRSGLLRAVLGPTATELGTGPLSLPNRLGPVLFDVGVIAGNRSLHPLGSFVLNGPNDGTVTEQNARVAGMRDFAAVHRAHSLIMRAPEVVAEVRAYLVTGCFSREMEEVSYDAASHCARHSQAAKIVVLSQ